MSFVCRKIGAENMLDISKRYVISGHQTAMVKQKLIEIRQDVIDAVAQDATRCGRSTNKQIEAILVAYFEMGDVNIELDPEAIRAIVSAPADEPISGIDAVKDKLGNNKKGGKKK
jgi:hypothetical protein